MFLDPIDISTDKLMSKLTSSPDQWIFQQVDQRMTSQDHTHHISVTHKHIQSVTVTKNSATATATSCCCCYFSMLQVNGRQMTLMTVRLELRSEMLGISPALVFDISSSAVAKDIPAQFAVYSRFHHLRCTCSSKPHSPIWGSHSWTLHGDFRPPRFLQGPLGCPLLYFFHNLSPAWQSTHRWLNVVNDTVTNVLITCLYWLQMIKYVLPRTSDQCPGSLWMPSVPTDIETGCILEPWPTRTGTCRGSSSDRSTLHGHPYCNSHNINQSIQTSLVHFTTSISNRSLTSAFGNWNLSKAGVERSCQQFGATCFEFASQNKYTRWNKWCQQQLF